MQAKQVQVEAAPKAPNPPIPPSVTTVGSDGKSITLAIPQTADEVAALRARREELSSQLNSVSERRSELVAQVRSSPEGAAKTGLEDRIRLLDQRTLGLESDIAAIGQQLASAAPNLMQYSSYSENRQPQNTGDDEEEGFMVGAGTVLVLVWAISAFRRYRRRKTGGSGETPRAIAADSARLERVEHALEAVAIEVERISEGQRFVTKLLAETSHPVAISASRESGRD